MLEILIVIAIGAILVAVAVPSLQDTISRNARDSIQLDLMSSLVLAIGSKGLALLILSRLVRIILCAVYYRTTTCQL